MSNTYTKLRHHLIFKTLDEQPLITPEYRDELFPYIGGIIRSYQGRLLEIGGTENHVHLLAGFPPSPAMADMVRLVKANSSKWLNERGPRPGWFRWEPGYGAFSVSETQVSRVRAFIRDQQAYHWTKSFGEEFGRFIERHGFELNEDTTKSRRTYVWQIVHVVFSTKNRMELIPSGIQRDLATRMRGLVAHTGSELLRVGGTADHVHLLVAVAPHVAVADLLQQVKRNSAIWMAEQGGRNLPFAWQRGYGAFSVSLSRISVVERYIKRQKEHHQTISFKDEFRKLLKEHDLSLRASG